MNPGDVGWPYSILGFSVGFLVGMTGVGGGSLMTPMLVLLFGVHPAAAVGTDLMFAGITKTVGTLVHGIHGSVKWRIVARLSAGSIPMAIFTLLLLRWIGPQHAAISNTICWVMGIALVATAGSLYARDLLLKPRQDQAGSNRQAALTIMGGALLGLLVTISSVGAGAMGIVALYFLYPLLPTRTLVGSDVAHAVPLTLLAGMGYWLLGAVDWTMLAWLLAGSVPGIVAGSLLAPRVSERVLRPILATILVLVGVRLLLP